MKNGKLQRRSEENCEASSARRSQFAKLVRRIFNIEIWNLKLGKNYREECQTNTDAKQEYDLMAENLRLRKQLEETEKENRFLKKAAAFFAKEIE